MTAHHLTVEQKLELLAGRTMANELSDKERAGNVTLS